MIETSEFAARLQLFRLALKEIDPRDRIKIIKDLNDEFCNVCGSEDFEKINNCACGKNKCVDT